MLRLHTLAPGIDVRPAQGSDAEGLGRVRVRSWRAAYRGLVPDGVLDGMDAQVCATRIRAAILAPRKAEHVLTAHDRGTPVGYAWLGLQTDRRLPFRGEVFELYVDPGAQGRGIGSALLRDALWSLVEARLDPPMVWVLAGNTARAFYEEQGGICVARGAVDVGGRSLPRLGYGWRDALPLPRLPHNPR